MTEWTDRVIAGARSGRPYEDNETSYNQLVRNYGFVFDENLTPIRGNDRNYAVGPLARGWWCFYYPSHAEKERQPHLFSPWGDRIVAAVQKGRTSGYGGTMLPEISFTMNLLPFLGDGAGAVAKALETFNPASLKILEELWPTTFKPAYDQIKKIVYWRPDGTFAGEVNPKTAVRIIEEAMSDHGIIAPRPAMVANEPKETAAVEAKDKDPIEKPAHRKGIDLGSPVIFRIAEDFKKGNLYAVALPATGLPEVLEPVADEDGGEGDDLVIRARPDGTARMRWQTTGTEALDGLPVTLFGVTVKMQWRQKRNRLVATLSAEQRQGILGI